MLLTYYLYTYTFATIRTRPAVEPTAPYRGSRGPDPDDNYNIQQRYNNQGRRPSSTSRYNNTRENEYLYEDDPPASDNHYTQQPQQQYNNQRYDEYSVQADAKNQSGRGE